MKHILIVDDDTFINDMVEKALVSEGYEVSKAYSGTEALLLLKTTTPDLVLLDLMLPGLTGEEVLPLINDSPVIVVSAKIDVKNMVDLLLGGAADYITKPFEVEELLARIKVQLRMSESRRTQEVKTLTGGGIELDHELMEASAGGNSVTLTRTECAILRLLMENAGRPLGRNTILERISEDTPDCTDRSLKQHISNIRKKLQTLDGLEHIEAIYGIGFKFKS